MDVKRGNHPLLPRMFGTYCLVLLIGIVLIEMHNIIVWQSSFRELLQFNIPAVTLFSLFLAVLLQAATWFRLRPYRRYAGGDPTVSGQDVLWRLLRFPNELFFAMVGATLLLSIVFHAIDILRAQNAFRLTADSLFLQGLLLSLLSEQLIGLTLALMLMGFSRHALRPVVRELQAHEIGQHSRSSMFRTLTWTFGLSMVIAFFSVFRYILVATWQQRPLEWTSMLILAGAYIVLGMVVLGLLSRGYRNEIQLMSEGIHRLSVNRGTDLHGKMAVMSLDETGRMTEHFNVLQERLQHKYEELQRDIQLAYDVQQQLLPANRWDFGFAEASALCIQDREVGGDLFDILPLDGERFVVMIGDVSGKGVSAALGMSSVLAQFRTEVHYGGSPEELLMRLNRHIAETLKGHMHVTLGIGLLDLRRGLQYASAGHMAPYLIRDGEVRSLPVSSLPLGLDEEYVYASMHLELEEGDRLLFYSDGVVEARVESGEMLGFGRLERLLAELPADESASAQLEMLTDRISSLQSRYDDDRTFLLVKWNARPDTDETKRTPIRKTWFIPSQLGAEKTIRAEIGRIATACGVSADRTEDMCTAVSEAIINAIEHGNRGRPDLDVCVKLCVQDDRFVFRIYDSGKGMEAVPLGRTSVDPSASGSSPPPVGGEARLSQEELPRGWGLFLMERLADRVSNGIDGQGHYCRLEFWSNKRIDVAITESDQEG